MELKDVMQKETAPPKRSGGGLSSFVVILATLGIAGGLGYLYWQEQIISKEIATWEERIARKQESIDKYNQESSLGALVRSEQILNRALNYRIEWSVVMDDILKIQKDFASGEIIFLQFSSDRNKKITISGRAKNWETVAQLLEKLKGASFPYVKNAFITTLSKKEEKTKNSITGSTSTSKRTEFRLIFEYVPQTSTTSKK